MLKRGGKKPQEAYITCKSFIGISDITFRLAYFIVKETVRGFQLGIEKMGKEAFV